MIKIELIYNLSILVAVSVLSGFIDSRYKRSTKIGETLQGILFGTAAIIGMLYPFVLSPGIIFDGRSIVISLCTLFFGPLSGIISAFLASAFRVYIGGSGVLMGLLVISASFFIGYVFRNVSSKNQTNHLSKGKLYIFGVVVHIAMLILMFTLPTKAMINAFKSLTLTVLGVYPVISLIIGKILMDQKQNLQFIDELSSREKLLRITLNSIGDAVISTDVEGKVVNTNASAESLLGWKENEVFGKHISEVFEIVNETTGKQIQDPASKVITDNTSVKLSNNILLISREGKEIPIAYRSDPIKNDEDNLDGVVVTFQDRTKEKETLRWVTESEKRFRLFYENAPIAYQSTDKQGRIIDVNPRWLETLGYNRLEVVGQYLFDFMTADSKLKIDEVYQKFIGSGELANFECEMLCSDGSNIFVSFEGKVGFDRVGNFEQAHWIFTDITKRIKSEEELNHVYELQSAIVDNAAYAIISTTPEGIIKTFNPSAERMLGYKADEVINRITPVLFHDPKEIVDRSNEISKELNIEIAPGFQVFVTRSKYNLNNEYEWTYISKDGTRFPVLLSITPMHDRLGNISGYLGIARDITESKKAEEEIKQKTIELSESEQKYRILFEKSRDAMFILDNNLFVDCNDSALSILKLPSKEQLKNIHPSELSPPTQPDGKQSFEKAEEMMSITKEKGSHRFEWLHLRSDGEKFYVEVSLTVIPFQGREIIHTAWRDITKRKVAERAIIGDTERLKSLVKILEYKSNSVQEILDYALSEAIKLTSSRFGYIYYYNEEKEEFILNSWSNEVMKECEIVDPQTCYELNKTGIWGEAVRQRKEIIVNDFKSVHPLKKGYPEGHVQLTKYLTIPVFDENKIVAVVGVANKESDYDEGDIQQLKLLMGSIWNLIKRKEGIEKIAQLSKAVEQSPVMVLISDKGGRIEYVNPKFIEITGYSDEEVIGQKTKILNSGYHNKRFYESLWETIQSGKTWRGEFRNRKKNGELYWENSLISPIRNERGEITRFISIKEDITEKKNMLDQIIAAKENAEKANLVKSEFLAQMSHEIRSPINAILSFTSLVEDEMKATKNVDMADCFSGIDSASKRVIRTIDSILNMSELQLGTYEVTTRTVDIKDLLEGLIKEYNKYAMNKNIDLKISVQSSNSSINTDDYAVNQIFANLIDNAIKYTMKGSIDIVIKDNENGKIIVDVIDTGKGIKSEYLPILFEPFSQEEQGYSRKFEGNGLGMSLVKKYCDLIEAEIKVESTYGIGTKFSVILNTQQ